MLIEDPIYGPINFEPVLADIIQSAAFQRLTRIHQAGGIFLIDPNIKHTRAEHSIGVCYLVRHFGGSLAEQIAALVHDISHTAFSHVADQVFARAGEDYHEEQYAHVLQASTIPTILESHGHDPALLYHDDYALLEQPYPYLCADRIDYTFRDLYHSGYLTAETVQAQLAALVVIDGRITFANETAEQGFKAAFQLLNEAYFRKPEYVFANERLAEILKAAISLGALSENELLLDDQAVIAKLNTHPKTRSLLADLRGLKGFGEYDLVGAKAKLKRREL